MTSLRWLGVLWVGLLMSGLGQAEPAYWYRWQSKLDGGFLCTQVPPGKGWQKIGGPFRNAQCRNPG